MSRKTPYDRCLEEMFQLRRFGIRLELATIRAILAALGHPQRQYPAIHIAGSNGKGSTASMLTTILSRAGYKVGLYTSPHLIRFNERIKINGREISDSRVAAAYKAVKDKHGRKRPPTFFEYTTAMAFYEFARQKVDVAVIETGMGGRYDATNVLTPILSIITNISLEHQAYLGKTLAAIAGEKAGIIKPRVPLITAVRQESAIAVIRQTAKEKKADCFRLGEQFTVRRHRSGDFSYSGPAMKIKNLSTRLPGAHQTSNAALAVAACEVLNSRGRLSIPEESIRQGLLEVRWPARLEIVSNNPLVIIDGAHNLAGAGILSRYLSTSAELAGKKILLVIGILDDKPYEAMLKKLVPLSDSVILTRAKIGRAIEPQVLARIVRPMKRRFEIAGSVEEAVRQAVDKASPADAICISGSLYVAGEARHALTKMGIIRGETPKAASGEMFLI
ncbi:MAG: folylpolyglutamate synthase/dihydrofolate synthase family protein [Thermodesulfobacteriota bacterium]